MKKTKIASLMGVIFYGLFLLFAHTAHADISSNLILYYQMEDNLANHTVADSSGNSHTGTLSANTSAASAAGKVNQGFNMQGSYSLDSNYTWLAADSNFTVAAWFKTTAVSQAFFSSYNGQKGLISASTDNGGRPECQVISGNGHFNFTFYNHSYSDGTWHHIACVMSGTTATMYMDGVAVNSVTDAGWTGDYRGNSPRTMLIGPSLAGSIDEARIYNRALSASDIAQLYAYNGAPTAPQISSVVSTTTATGTTITWTTNQSASSTVYYGPTSSYGYASTSDAMSTLHTIVLTGLTGSTLYHFQAASGNSSGLMGTSSDYTFMTRGVDITAPTISSVASTTSFTSASISWTTDELATSKVSYGTVLGIYTTSTSSASLLSSHSLNLTGLSASTNYYYVVVSADASGNIATSSERTFLTGTPDTSAPQISSVTISTAATTVTIAWTTDEAASSTVEYGFTPSYGTASTSAIFTTSHSIKLTGLVASTTYDFRIRSADASDNVATSSNLTFTTDTTPGITLCGGSCMTFHDGDVVGIVGDSITSVDMYIAYLESYFDLRYPNIHLHFRDLSRSGASILNYTGGGQYMGQINPLSPNVVILMMTNNGGFTEQQFADQVNDLDANYIVATSSATPLFLGPPPYNTSDGVFLLSEYSDELGSIAQAKGYAYANVWSNLHSIFGANLASSTPVDIQDGGDADHMGPPAHLAIAYTYLNQLNADPNVSSASIDASDAQVVSETNAAVTNVTKTSQGVDFTRLDARLPMAYDDRSLPIFEIMPQIYDQSRYMLTVRGLDPGNYYVYIDGVPSGSASSDQLAAGWNMSTMTSGPIHDQLQDVLSKIRAQAGLDRVTRNILSPNTGMIEYISAANSCYIDQGLTGAALKSCVAAAVSSLNGLDDQIYAAAQPTSHAFSLRKASGPADATPPVISNPVPSAPLPQGTTSTTVSIDTDETATCKYDTVPQTPYIWMSHTFDTTGGTTHSTAFSGLLDGATYTYYIRCQDQHGNRDMTDYKLTLSVNADPNPVAYYKFDEGSGSSAADSSGNGHTASLLNSPTWVPGKIGAGALSFNGVNNAVSVGGISGAGGVGAISISAWVKGPGTLSGSSAYSVVTKYSSGQGSWALQYSGASSVYDCLMVNNSGASATALGPIVALNDTNWHLVTCVYNGSNITVYTDGVAGTAGNSPALTGVVQDRAYPVCIGSISDGTVCVTNAGGLWPGTIDDVRLYKRALSAAEILKLYAGDTTAPVISSVAASTTAATATITWTTDEAATSTVEYGTDASYGSASSSAAFGLSHSLMLSGLTASTMYHFQVASADVSGNIATSSDLVFTTAAAPDTTAPVISGIAASSSVEAATIGWITDESSDSMVSYGTTSGMYTANAASSSLVTSHSVDISGLSASTTYFYVISSTDPSGNISTSSELVFTTSVPPDTAAPVISSIAATTTDASATITWITDEDASSTLNFGLDSNYGNASSSDAFETAHMITLGGLDPSTTYHYQIISTDIAGNNGTSSDITFTTAAAPDITAPVISEAVSSSSVAAATIVWNTDEPSDSTVSYGTVSGTYTASTSSPSLVTAHSVDLTGLSASTTYFYVISSADASGNIATSSDLVFTTAAAPDTAAPMISSVIASTTDASATVAWSTDEVSDSAVFYGIVSGEYAVSASSTEFVASHSIGLVGLSASTTYYYVAVSTDPSGNAATSSEQTLTTAAAPGIAAPVISNVTSTGTDAAATITWNTDELATSTIEYGSDSSYGSASTSDEMTTSHSVTLDGLVSGTLYHFRVSSADASGNISTSSDLTFETATPAPQVISSIATSTTSDSATISWMTGGAATGATPARHSMILSGLLPSTTYQFKVVYDDDLGNDATSTDVIFTTAQ